MFSFEFYEISKNNFFTGHLWTTTSVKVEKTFGKVNNDCLTLVFTKRSTFPKSFDKDND